MNTLHLPGLEKFIRRDAYNCLAAARKKVCFSSASRS